MATVKQLGLMIDISRCTGCKTCIVACRNFMGLLDHEKAMPNQIAYYLRVESKREGTYPNISVDSWVVPCQHCTEPECVEACPENAITKNESGVVIIDQSLCTGCKECIDACPYSVIMFDEDGAKAHKCDLCWELIQKGEVPVCAETCMTDAIMFGEVELLKMKAQAAGKSINTELTEQSIIYVK
ncbi:MAG: 4Fe-4S dicluster domain-containing protein [Candidatus Thorarchaeota archaeon]